MGFAVISLIVVLLISGFAFYLVRENSTGQTDEIIGETFDAWRNKELNNDAFEVKVHQSSVTDVFHTFQKDEGNGYLQMSEINTAMQGVAAFLPNKATFKIVKKNFPQDSIEKSEEESAIAESAIVEEEVEGRCVSEEVQREEFQSNEVQREESQPNEAQEEAQPENAQEE